MKFFFPDSQDFVDPSFDFNTERRSATRIRQRDDLYAHEVFDQPPFDGILVSRAALDSGRYSIPQKHRFLRVGVRTFFRLTGSRLKTMGDCGAFSYKNESEPPYSTLEVLTYYEELGFDYGLSVDHMIGAFTTDETGAEAEWVRRQELTLYLAEQFKQEHRKLGCRVVPIGVAQGWSPGSYASAVSALHKMGYSYIALGGMVPLKTNEIVACLEAVNKIRPCSTKLHLLGVTRLERIRDFERLGAASFDSTSPLLQAFKDQTDNYHTSQKTYSAIRVPQVENNPELSNRIKAGTINQALARRMEQDCLRMLVDFDAAKVSIDEVLRALREYEALYDGRRDRTLLYREVLSEQPWKSCPCNVCRSLGIHVVLFRGAERNRRRGFHNVYVLYRQLHLEFATEQVPSTDERLSFHDCEVISGE